MPIKSVEVNRVVLAAVETTENTLVAAAAANVILTNNLQAADLVYDAELLQFDSIGADVRDIMEQGSNLHWKFGFDCPVTVSGAVGTKGALSPILRGCGFNEIVATTGVTYTPGNASTLDSLTMRLRQEKNATTHLEYVAGGCRGQLGLEIVSGKRAVFKITNMMGSFNMPAEVPAIAPAYGTQKTNLSDQLLKETLTTYTLNGKPLCAYSLIVDNLSGFDMKREYDLCNGGSTMGTPVTPVGKLQFTMPDWTAAAEFNPWVVADPRAMTRIPFVLAYGKTAGKIINLTVTQSQATKPKQVRLSNGNLGMEVDVRFLSGMSLLFK
ncbi:hypothetical protein [Thiolinea disciformis]|uniref:hypothetical protein n=1 Tax=Thiolinea disciformis TaxID=125614 RepID=UPI000360DF37|nr:hypothetical protein [Thiolinea disciformis]